MKLLLLRTGLLTCLLFLGWSYEQTFAATTIPTKCTKYGDIKPGMNPSVQMINCLLTNAAVEANIPPEVVKGIAAKESDWRQFDSNGQPLMNTTGDGGIGIMQITNQTGFDGAQLKNDIVYNINAGVQTLGKLFTNPSLPKIKGADRNVIENWYFPVMAYNGIEPVNSPIVQATGQRNLNTYQDGVFAGIENDSFLGETPLAQFPFKSADFTYDPTSTKPIQFNQLIYTVTGSMNVTKYFFKTGDQVTVTADDVKLRSQPSASTSDNIIRHLSKNTTLIINGDFTYDQTNRFVWYPVKTTDNATGYVSSAYISNGWLTQNGSRYHYTNGVVNTGWYQDGNNYYYLDPSKGGAMSTGWVKLNNRWYYFNPATGVRSASAWIVYGGTKYHVDANGIMQTGWVSLGNYWYCFDASGAMQTGWLKWNNGWYYLGNNGVMKTGWLQLGQDWYYLDGSGKMLTGWQKINGKWYYLYTSGKMAHDTKIGNYRLGHSGAML